MKEENQEKRERTEPKKDEKQNVTEWEEMKN